MARSSRVIVVFAVALLAALEAAAGARPVPVNPAKVVPKIGSVTQTANAAQLAALLVGTGVTITNAKFTGNPLAAGTFTGGAASVGVASGVVLSTGHAADVVGPNVSDSWSEDNGTPGDAQLNALVYPEVTYDAAILEFDVTPTANTIAIRFVFGSEEYQEFVGSPYNDVIGIFVNGVNCANYNGRPISVNSINAGVNSELFINNESGARDTELDGLTVPLDCVASVTPGVPNHVKIAIADTADAIYDAAVFLAAGGVRSPGSGPVTNSNVYRAIEYYHAGFNHYFETAIAGEITKLDDGTFVGWVRTGRAFNVYATGTVGTVGMCRFFSAIPGALISTHFYTLVPSECATLKANANWVYEDTVFGVVKPLALGACPAGTQTLYRLYNNSQGGIPNHRYVVDTPDVQSMVGKGWVVEGDYGVFACVPL